MNVYQEVTDRMIASLEAGVVPWRQPWKARAAESRYSKEELVAEFTAAFICAETGIRNDRLDEQHAAYLAGWLHALKNDKSLVVGAAQRAQRAADLILGRTFQTQEPSDVEAVEATACRSSRLRSCRPS
jgi:antirestriction protein ArdC